MEGYKSDLVQFRRTTKMRQLSGWFGRITETSTFQKIVLSLGSDWEEKTYEEFEELRVSLLRQEVFFQSSLHLCGVLTGSLFVALVIPKSIDVAVMRQMLGEYQLLKFLMDSGILSIYAEQVCLIQDVPTALSHHNKNTIDAYSKTSLATDISTPKLSKLRPRSPPLSTIFQIESKDPPEVSPPSSHALPDIGTSLSEYKLEHFKYQQPLSSQDSKDLDTISSLELPSSGTSVLPFLVQCQDSPADDSETLLYELEHCKGQQPLSSQDSKDLDTTSSLDLPPSGTSMPRPFFAPSPDPAHNSETLP